MKAQVADPHPSRLPLSQGRARPRLGREVRSAVGARGAQVAPSLGSPAPPPPGLAPAARAPFPPPPVAVATRSLQARARRSARLRERSAAVAAAAAARAPARAARGATRFWSPFVARGPAPSPRHGPRPGPSALPAAGPHGAAGRSFQCRLRRGPRQLHLGERRARLGVGTPAGQVRTSGRRGPARRPRAPLRSPPRSAGDTDPRGLAPAPVSAGPAAPNSHRGADRAASAPGGRGCAPAPAANAGLPCPRAPPAPSPEAPWARAFLSAPPPCAAWSWDARIGARRASGAAGSCDSEWLGLSSAGWAPDRRTRRGGRPAPGSGQGGPSFRRLLWSSENMKVWGGLVWE